MGVSGPAGARVAGGPGAGGDGVPRRRSRAARPGWSARAGRAQWRVPVIAVAILAILACGQAVADSVVAAKVAVRHGVHGPAYLPTAAIGPGAPALTLAQMVETALPLCLLALAAPVPLAALRPLPAAVC